MQSKVMLDNRNSDKIFIRNLRLEMSVGIYDHEKENVQPVIVNITIEVESNTDKKLHGIDDVISYEEIINSVTILSKSKHYDLLEEFAEDISNICLKDKRCISVKIATDKPDIIKNCNTVGIEIIRSRPQK